MSSALKSKGRKVYDIPICTVCLDPMIKDLAIFVGCGHVFHYNCAINCHSNSRKCPNCRLRSTEIQSLHYQVDEISGIDEQMNQILTNLSQDQQSHMAKLLIEHENLLHENQKITQRNNLVEEKQLKLQQELDELLKEKNRITEYSKSIEEKRRDINVKYRTIEIAYEAIQDENKNQHELIQTLKEQMKEFSYYKQLQNTLQNKDEDNYIKTIRLKSLNEQVQQIYDMYVIKNSKCKQLENENDKLNEELQQVKRKYNAYQQQQNDLVKENKSFREFINNNNNNNNNIKQKIISQQALDYQDENSKFKRQVTLKFGSQTLKKPAPQTSLSLLKKS